MCRNRGSKHSQFLFLVLGVLCAPLAAFAEDAGAADAAVVDAGLADAAQPVDAAQPADAGPSADAAPAADAAGSVDAAGHADASTPDAAGQADAGVPDAASPADAAVTDAAAPVDAGTPDAAVPFAALIQADGSGDVCLAPCRALESATQEPITLTAVVQGSSLEQGATVLWDLRSRPQGAQAEIQSPTLETAALSPDQEGQYEVVLTATNTLTGERSTAQLTLEVLRVAFVTSVVVTVDGRTEKCDPECPRGNILIGEKVTVDASGTLHDPFHGTLVFQWAMDRPPGAASQLVDEGGGKVSFRPDVDGAWQVRVNISDDVDQEERFISFVIPTAAHWDPPEPSCGQAPVQSGFPLHGMVVMAWGLGWGLRRRMRAVRRGAR